MLVLNAGSSSLKYQLVVPESGEVLAEGLVERIGEDGSGVADHCRRDAGHDEPGLRDDGVDLDETCPPQPSVTASSTAAPTSPSPSIIDDAVLRASTTLSALAPLHNPAAAGGHRGGAQPLRGARTSRSSTPPSSRRCPRRRRRMPCPATSRASTRSAATASTARRTSTSPARTADLLGRALEQLQPGRAPPRQRLLRLGDRAAGVAVDTSMGLTPLEGLVMGTRSGDVDPGSARLPRARGRAVARRRSTPCSTRGRACSASRGVNDFRELEQRLAAGDHGRPRLAFDVVVHRLKHYVGAYLAMLGALDVLVFTAGVGENSVSLRAAVTDGLDELGITVDRARNAARSEEARVISPRRLPRRRRGRADQRGARHRPPDRRLSSADRRTHQASNRKSDPSALRTRLTPRARGRIALSIRSGGASHREAGGRRAATPEAWSPPRGARARRPADGPSTARRRR